MRDYLKLDNMLNPPGERDNREWQSEWCFLSAEETDLSTTADSEATRYLINMETGEVKTETFENLINNKYINKFGKINT